MKIIASDVAPNKDAGFKDSWFFIPDSALTNAGKPFFIPEFADVFETVLAPAVRLNRLGKSISSKFASRYYAEIAPAIHFRAPDLYESLYQRGASPDAARSFDRSLIAGDFFHFDNDIDSVFSLVRNGSIISSISITDILNAMPSFLEAVSAANTVKMGDIFIPLFSEGVRINIGDVIDVLLNEVRLLSVAIK